MKRDDRRLQPVFVMLACAAIFSLLLLMAAEGKAADPSADYPSRPITYVTHASIGGSMHIFGQLISDIIQKEKILTQPIVVVNKTGSGGGIACGYTYEKKGNPYVFMGVSSATFLTLPLLENVPYTSRSFVPIANMATEGAV